MNATIHTLNTALKLENDQYLPDLLCREALRFRNATAKLAAMAEKRDLAYARMREVSDEMSTALETINEGQEPARDIAKIAADLKRAHAGIDKELDKFYDAMAEIESARDALTTSMDVLKGLPLAANA